MASRKQKIKSKREQEQKEIQQVRMAVGIFVALIAIGIFAYIATTSGWFDPAPVDVAQLSDVTGTPQEICNQATPAIANGENGMYSSAPAMALDANVDYQAVICTEAGAIHVELYEDRTPETVNSFVFLANDNYYNQTIFHRVIEGFMAQAGDPTGTGSGGPGYQFGDETFDDLAFDRPYLLAMANAGPGTNGSQFFITFAPTPWLDGAHTIFGEVISGQENVDAITLTETQAGRTGEIPMILEAVVIVTPDQVTQ